MLELSHSATQHKPEAGAVALGVADAAAVRAAATDLCTYPSYSDAAVLWSGWRRPEPSQSLPVSANYTTPRC